MPGFDTLLAFLIATAIFAYIPGPAMLYATAQTLARGARAGLMAALGIHIGGYVHVLAAAFGLAILFELVPPLYLALKLIGAAYLIWLGIQMIRTRNARVNATPQGGRDPVRAFRQSMTVEILNPKTALFFVAFLPQFSDPGAALPIWAQLLILGTVVNIMFSSADLVCVALASRMSRLLARSGQATARAKALGGSILVGLGLTVALDR
ncbi:LysE family translocator [Tateyamaria omphalii]|uniref:LysE family translocator n=1 Tax=Tateyamaria omphalii TaxID=299262 RepID=UPI001C992D3D|nr:LysE family translocator [Tateyamaria omphalii]MBY5933462.1 LysE family translocator [Tateyamaria omphalii]